MFEMTLIWRNLNNLGEVTIFMKQNTTKDKQGTSSHWSKGGVAVSLNV